GDAAGVEQGDAFFPGSVEQVVGLGEHRGDGQPLAGLGRDLELEGLSRPDVAGTEGSEFKLGRFDPTKSKAYPVSADVDLPRKWPWGRSWEDSQGSSLPGSTDARIERTSGLANGRAGLFPSPALGERRHRSLARRLVAVCWRAILMLTEGERPQPRG